MDSRQSAAHDPVATRTDRLIRHPALTQARDCRLMAAAVPDRDARDSLAARALRHLAMAARDAHVALRHPGSESGPTMGTKRAGLILADVDAELSKLLRVVAITAPPDEQHRHRAAAVLYAAAAVLGYDAVRFTLHSPHERAVWQEQIAELLASAIEALIDLADPVATAEFIEAFRPIGTLSVAPSGGPIASRNDHAMLLPGPTIVMPWGSHAAHQALLRVERRYRIAVRARGAVDLLTGEPAPPISDPTGRRLPRPAARPPAASAEQPG